MKQILLTILACGVCYTIGYYSRAPLTTTTTVARDVNTDTTKDKHAHTVTTIEKRPDGTEVKKIESTTETIGHTTIKEHDNTTTKAVETRSPQWAVGLYRSQTSYVATVDRRLFSNVFFGIYVRKEAPAFELLKAPEVGIGLRIEF